MFEFLKRLADGDSGPERLVLDVGIDDAVPVRRRVGELDVLVIDHFLEVFPLAFGEGLPAFPHRGRARAVPSPRSAEVVCEDHGTLDVVAGPPSGVALGGSEMGCKGLEGAVPRLQGAIVLRVVPGRDKRNDPAQGEKPVDGVVAEVSAIVVLDDEGRAMLFEELDEEGADVPGVRAADGPRSEAVAAGEIADDQDPGEEGVDGERWLGEVDGPDGADGTPLEGVGDQGLAFDRTAAPGLGEGVKLSTGDAGEGGLESGGADDPSHEGEERLNGGEGGVVDERRSGPFGPTAQAVFVPAADPVGDGPRVEAEALGRVPGAAAMSVAEEDACDDVPPGGPQQGVALAARVPVGSSA